MLLRHFRFTVNELQTKKRYFEKTETNDVHLKIFCSKYFPPLWHITNTKFGHALRYFFSIPLFLIRRNRADGRYVRTEQPCDLSKQRVDLINFLQTRIFMKQSILTHRVCVQFKSKHSSKTFFWNVSAALATFFIPVSFFFLEIWPELKLYQTAQFKNYV